MSAAHIHLLLNHIPILGSIFGLLLLLYATLKKNDAIKRVCLGVFIITALMTIPVYLSGDGAARIVRDLPDVSRDIIREHDSAATFAIISSELLGAVSLLAWWLTRNGKRLATWMLITVILLAVWSSSVAMRTGQLGGEVRHSEVRALP